MKYLIFLILFILGGCTSSYKTQLSTLAVDDRVSVINAKVSNPYPSCDENLNMRRIANLSVERSERVYLQGQKLCQRNLN
ncbi:hypothetical protein FQP81_18180 [Pseudoalteromonas distincta]|uniref:hypothetical protein n=1 Tax=Pseudoalteromonas TaxID=53246 RepID=UPI000C32C5AE|nr:MULTISPECIES: hypothetical protein [Pseudoalteromonas]PKG68599.1 hypothetical protein CXF64_19960 [Pseudoalteromonas sp. GutCa3]TVU70384.1 hypothetical protein FQP81_18180 [Pseudoalteromonas elyakovii]